MTGTLAADADGDQIAVLDADLDQHLLGQLLGDEGVFAELAELLDAFLVHVYTDDFFSCFRQLLG